MTPTSALHTYARLTCVLLAATALVFSLWPGLDLWISALFWTPEDRFWIAQSAGLQILRKALWQLMTVTFLFSTAMWLVAAFWRPVFGVEAWRWAFSSLLFLIGPGLIVNAILKEYWGRARPAQVMEFGGERLFTPALQIADQCNGNCSFVSGEGSGAAALAFATLILTQGLHNRPLARVILWTVVPLSFLATALRVLMGRHFFSDTLFAVLIVAGLGLFLLWLLPRSEREKAT